MSVPGGVRLRPAHLAALRPLLPGGPEAVLPGGLRHRRHHLHPGELAFTVPLPGLGVCWYMNMEMLGNYQILFCDFCCLALFKL